MGVSEVEQWKLRLIIAISVFMICVMMLSLLFLIICHRDKKRKEKITMIYPTTPLAIKVGRIDSDFNLDCIVVLGEPFSRLK